MAWTRGGCARRPPTVPGAWAPIIVPRIRGTRETPWPFPDHRTECRVPAVKDDPYGWRRFACAEVTARRMRSVRTSDRKTGGNSTLFRTSPSREYTWTWPAVSAGLSGFFSLGFGSFSTFVALVALAALAGLFARMRLFGASFSPADSAADCFVGPGIEPCRSTYGFRTEP